MASLAALNSAARLPVPPREAEADARGSPSSPAEAEPEGRPVAGPTSERVTKPAAPRPRPGM